MIILEIENEVATELKQALSRESIPSDIVTEERYFGDAQLVTFVVSNIGSALGVVAATLSIISARQPLKIVIEGRQLNLDTVTAEKVREIIAPAEA